MNKKAQVMSVFVFIFIAAGLLILAPVILKLGTSILDRLGTQFSSIDQSNKTSNVVGDIRGRMTGSMDWFIMGMIFIDILILLITSFLIDISPAFLIVYIIGAFVLVLTAPYTIAVAENIYSASQFSVGSDNVVQYLPMSQFIMNNFGVFIVIVLFLTGIIMYAKLRMGGSSTPTY